MFRALRARGMLKLCSRKILEPVAIATLYVRTMICTHLFRAFSREQTPLPRRLDLDRFQPSAVASWIT